MNKRFFLILLAIMAMFVIEDARITDSSIKIHKIEELSEKICRLENITSQERNRMKFRVIRYMTGYAIQRKSWFRWSYIRYGDYWNCPYEELDGKIIMFNEEKEATDWLKNISKPGHEYH